MLTIGLCGGSGSGKGAACETFLALGIPTIDTDAIYHQLTSGPSDCLRELTAEFGEGIITNGALNRRKLADIVFAPDASPELHKRLNSIAHRHILARAREISDKYRREGKSAVVIDAPLLFESGLDAECDVTLAVVADLDKRIERIMARDGITKIEAVRRIRNQLPDDYLISRVDYVITNNGGIDELKQAVFRFVEKILPQRQ